MKHFFKGEYPVSNPFGVYDPSAYGGYPGQRHPGNDYPLPRRTPLYAPISGITTVYDRPAGVKVGRGKEVVITNGPTERKACHMDEIVIQNGIWVPEGTFIGYSGNTGYVRPEPTPKRPDDGAHLHAEMKVNGVYVDEETYKEEPMNYLDSVITTDEDEHNFNIGWVGRPLLPQEIGRYKGKTVREAQKIIAQNANRKDIDKMINAYYKNNSQIPNQPDVQINGVPYGPKGS